MPRLCTVRSLLLLGLQCLALAAPPLQRVKLAHLTGSPYEALAGNYRVAPDRVISIGPSSEADGFPVFFDSGTRRTGVLYPISDSESVTGTLHDGDTLTPSDIRVRTEVDNGIAVRLWWQQGRGKPLTGMRVGLHREEEVVFRSVDATLRGTLTLPVAPGRHPAVVLLQEAGPRKRPFGFWPHLLAGYGLATLTFDKRGSGESTGAISCKAPGSATMSPIRNTSLIFMLLLSPIRKKVLQR
jgi:hypothetical protein